MHDTALGESTPGIRQGFKMQPPAEASCCSEVMQDVGASRDPSVGVKVRDLTDGGCPALPGQPPACQRWASNQSRSLLSRSCRNFGRPVEPKPCGPGYRRNSVSTPKCLRAV